MHKEALRCSLFPSVTLGLPIKRNYLQFQLISQKQFPSFWAVTPETTVVDERTIETGNPELKPSRIYDASLMFILRCNTFMVRRLIMKNGYGQLRSTTPIVFP